MRRRCGTSERAAIAGLLALAATAHAGAQTVVGGTQDLHFDRPESWAQKYFASVTLFGGLGVGAPLDTGGVELGVEAGWVPSLSDAERTVGFDGVKQEDLNKTDVFGRLRVRVGLPAGIAIEVGVTPPVEVGGATPELYALSVERLVWSGARSRVGLRLHGQTGTIEGDFTCPADVAAAGDDPVLNPFLCQAPSEDQYRPDTLGLEAGGAFPLRDGRLTPYVTASANHIDSELRVRAEYAGVIDRTVLSTDGWTWSAAAGVDWTFAGRWRLTSELFYSPLDVVRPPSTDTRNDGLFNARVALRVRLR